MREISSDFHKMLNVILMSMETDDKRKTSNWLRKRSYLFFGWRECVTDLLIFAKTVLNYTRLPLLLRKMLLQHQEEDVK